MNDFEIKKVSNFRKKLATIGCKLDSIGVTKKHKKSLAFIHDRIQGSINHTAFTDKFDFMCKMFNRKRCEHCNGLGHIDEAS